MDMRQTMRAAAAVGAGIAAIALVAACSDDASDGAETTPAPSTSANAGAGAHGDSDGDSSPTPVPDRIVCGTQYRPDADTTAGATEPTLVVERLDQPPGETETLEFENMTLSVSYMGDTDIDGGRTVNIAVYGSSEDDPIASTLYQFGDLDLSEIDYAGGHGFTGLNYIYHEGSMLQVWCEATRE